MAVRYTDRAKVVYFMRAEGTGRIKIGEAICARARLEAVKLMCPVPIEILGVIHVDAGSNFERELHARFAHLRSHGEWFCEAADLLIYIEEHAVPAPPVKRLSLLERRQKNAVRRAKRKAAEERRRSPIEGFGGSLQMGG